MLEDLFVSPYSNPFNIQEDDVITGPPEKVSGVSPANGATNQQLDIVITWSRPAMARTYDVYLDTVNPPVTKVSDDQTARVYVPTLALDTTYYLKINAANALGETAGDVVSFSTEFAPSSLFRANEQGVWYDPSDLTTLFQDAAGTIPVTAVEQPVGLMLDKSGMGNPAYQATSANRPTLSARYNVLLATETLETQSVTTQATSYKLTFTGTGSITLSGTATGTYLAGTHTITCAAGTLTLTVGGSVTKADLRPSNHGTDLPAYQRVTTSTDYDTVGFPPYLAFNGTSSSMATNRIDFSATDKMSVWAGVRRLTSAAGIISELSTNTNEYPGSMMFITGLPPNGIGNAFGAASRGTQTSTVNHWGYTPVTFTPPVTAVLMGAHSISDDLSSCRGNGVSGRNGTYDKGTGNFGNYPLYIGARNQSQYFFNGYIYSLIIRGAQSTNKQVSNAESWINKKIGKVY